MTEMTPAPVIPAATILLLRDAPAFEVLMVERHADISFAGGALVFPGGRIGDGDHDPAWSDHCGGLDAAPTEQRGPRIAAIREAFEETGILLACEAGEAGFIGGARQHALGEWRAIVENDDRKFLDLIRRENLTLMCDALHLFARWVPPPAARHRRYDTWFFAARTPAGQEACEDGNEATEAIWISPADALSERDSGKRKMIFPTSRNVELLGVSDCADGVLEFAAQRKIAPVQPEIIERGGARFLAIPDDLGYPITQEPLESALRT